MVSLPDIVFAEGDAYVLAARLKFIYEAVRRAAGERTFKLADADPLRLVQLSEAALLAQVNTDIDITGKGNLLYYAGEETIEHLGHLYGTRGDRLQPAAALTTIRYELSAPRAVATTIPAGYRTTADNKVFFATTENLEIAPGDTVGEVQAQCLSVGEVGNGFEVGEIKNIVDRNPFVAAAYNTTVSAGGADTEEIEAYRARIRLLPESFSVAGPDGAYEFWAKTASAEIVDVAVWSPPVDLRCFSAFLSELFTGMGISADVNDEMAEYWRDRLYALFAASGTGPGNVNIAPLMRGGELPTQDILDKVFDILDVRNRRPLTDWVHVLPPREVAYSIAFKYWILQSDSTQSTAIQAAVEGAVAQYIAWQCAKLGRDINPSYLHQLVMEAGAKRVVIESPAFTVLEADEVGRVSGDAQIIYMGLEVQ